MSASTQGYKDRQFLAVIGDEDSVTGLLLAGIGHVSDDGEKKKNFSVVDSKTAPDAIERAFDEYTTGRKDIAVLLINQHVCTEIQASRPQYFKQPNKSASEI